MYPTSDQIDQEHAKFLYEQHCAILVIEQLPVGSEFGIDLAAFTIGHKFKGVKMIPPGVHFVFAATTDKSNTHCGPRSGFFYEFGVKEMLIKRWSAKEEDFDDYQPDEEHQHRYLANLRDLDPYLAPYRYSTYNTFLNLTNKLTPTLVKNLMPRCNRVRSVPYLVRDASKGSQIISRTRRMLRNEGRPPTEEDLLPDLKPAEDTLIRFTKIPKYHFDFEQKIANDLITQYHLDSTMKLENAFKDEEGRERLLGEFQFAFITLILCHVYDCFKQWRQILSLVCMADSAINKYPSFFKSFAEILCTQLDQIPEDLFEDITDLNNLVRCRLDTFFRNVNECQNANEDLANQVQQLRKLAEDKFGWQFELEQDDEQPVIVNLC